MCTNATSRDYRFVTMAFEILSVPFLVFIVEDVRGRGVERRNFYNNATNFRGRIRVKDLRFRFTFRYHFRIFRNFLVILFKVECSIFGLRCLCKRSQCFTANARTFSNDFRRFLCSRTTFKEDIYSVVSKARRSLVSPSQVRNIRIISRSFRNLVYVFTYRNMYFLFGFLRDLYSKFFSLCFCVGLNWDFRVFTGYLPCPFHRGRIRNKGDLSTILLILIYLRCSNNRDNVALGKL